MTDCAICGRTLDALETKYCTKVKNIVGAANATWCADCSLKYPVFVNER